MDTPKHLNITLLGSPAIETDHLFVDTCLPEKARALLFYLSASPTPKTRAFLATLLWGTLNEDASRQNLRIALSRLRKILGNFLIVDRHTLSIDRNCRVTSDLDIFLASVDSEDDHKLRESAGYYTGPFLENFEVRKAPDFERWKSSFAVEIEEVYIMLLHKIVKKICARSDYQTSIHYTKKILDTDPLRESAHRHMIWLCGKTGQREAALRYYKKCERIFEAELGIAPSSKTRKLIEDVIEERLPETIEESA